MPPTGNANHLRSGHPPSFDRLSEDMRRVLRTELLRDVCSAAGTARLFCTAAQCPGACAWKDWRLPRRVHNGTAL